MAWPGPLDLSTSRAVSVIACASIFPAIATVSVIARLVARYSRRAGLWWDDWLILVALLACYGQTVIVDLSVVYGGVGFHNNVLNANNLEAYNKLLAAVQFTFGTSMGFAKLSICCLLVRAFKVSSFTKWAIAVMVYCAAWAIMTISIGAGLCRPFSYNWDKTVNGHCGDKDAAYISIAALDIVGNLAIIILPMPMIRRLSVTSISKVGLAVLFALGCATVIISILRLVFLTQVSFTPTSDYTWDSTETYIFSIIEPCLAITVGCACALQPLFDTCLPNRSTTRRPRTSPEQSGDSSPSYSTRSDDNDITPLKYPEKVGRDSPSTADLEAHHIPISSRTSFSAKRGNSESNDEVVVINTDVVVQQQSLAVEVTSPRTDAHNTLLQQWEMATISNPHAK